MKPCTTSSSTPIASSPRKCMSSLRLPMLSPPGIATRASPQRASSGPSTLIDARMRVDELVGRLRVQRRRRVDLQLGGAGPLDVRADRAQHVDHHVEVGDGIDVAQRGDAGREQRRRHLLGARVLGRARDAHACRASGPPARTTNESVIAARHSAKLSGSSSSSISGAAIRHTGMGVTMPGICALAERDRRERVAQRVRPPRRWRGSRPARRRRTAATRG